MVHTEGGWPKDVNPADGEAKKRFVNKVMKEDRYIKSVKTLGSSISHIINQNNSLNIYDAYFLDKQQTTNLLTSVKSKSSATILTIFKDPCTKYKRAANNISFIPSDGKKIAIAYCVPQAQDIDDTSSYIWDINNPNSPDGSLVPTSPLTCIEYNPKETAIIVGGAANGTLCKYTVC